MLNTSPKYQTAKMALTSTDQKLLFIVDDETELLATLAESLREFGYSPRTFEKPSELLGAISENDVGCVITDLRMPGIGGVELLQCLNHQESCLSLILLTAFADVPTAVDAMKLGAVSVVEKPFDLDVLTQEIQTAMQASERSFERRETLRKAKKQLHHLSQEEKAVLNLAIEGKPNREIAEQLSISPRTVDRRRRSALQKLHAESVAEYAVLKTLAESA